MNAVVADRPRAFVAWFRDTLRWDVAFFQQVNWRWPEGVIRPVGDAVVRRRTEVYATVDPVSVPIIEKISFGGRISVTQPDDRVGYKGRLFWADAGALFTARFV